MRRRVGRGFAGSFLYYLYPPFPCAMRRPRGGGGSLHFRIYHIVYFGLVLFFFCLLNRFQKAYFHYTRGKGGLLSNLLYKMLEAWGCHGVDGCTIQWDGASTWSFSLGGGGCGLHNYSLLFSHFLWFDMI